MKLKLTDYEKNHLLNRLPKVELSYDTMIHKKVFDKIDYYLAVPKGNRSLLWFTYYQTSFVVVVIKLNRYNKYEDVCIYTSCFDKELALKETLIYGYEFQKDENIFFACINIFIYKGECVKSLNYKEKFAIFRGIFSREIKQVNYCKDSLIIGLPVICDKYKDMYTLNEKAIYETNGIMYLQENEENPYGISYLIKRSHNAVFKVKASIQNDIYYLFYKEQDVRETGSAYDIALIDTYKKSVMMNKIFRNIKENQNLDLLEESDEDEEFENMAEDKYVNTEKLVNIKCVFNNKFKKWQPIEKTLEQAISRRDLQNITYENRDFKYANNANNANNGRYSNNGKYSNNKKTQ